jgi:hypothetical protein
MRCFPHPECLITIAPANQDTPARAPERIRRLAGEKDTFIV